MQRAHERGQKEVNFASSRAWRAHLKADHPIRVMDDTQPSCGLSNTRTRGDKGSEAGIRVEVTGARGESPSSRAFGAHGENGFVSEPGLGYSRIVGFVS